MDSRIVQHQCLIVVRSGSQELARRSTGNTHHGMPGHKRSCCTLALGERQELRRKLAQHGAVESDKVGDATAEQN